VWAFPFRLWRPPEPCQIRKSVDCTYTASRSKICSIPASPIGEQRPACELVVSNMRFSPRRCLRGEENYTISCVALISWGVAADGN